MSVTAPARSRTLRSSILIVAVLAAAGLLPLGQTPQYALTLAGVYGIAAVGLDLLAGYGGQPSFGHYAFLAVGAYTGVVLRTDYGIPWPAALLLAMLSTALVAGILGSAMVRLRSFGLAASTLFLGFVVRNLLAGDLLTDFTGSAVGRAVDPLTTAGGAALGPRSLFFVVLAGLAVTVLFCGWYVNSPSGRRLRLVKRSDALASVFGVSPYRTRWAAFVLSAAFAGLAGFLLAPLVGIIIPESFNPSDSINLFAMVVIGGIGTLGGGIVGAVTFVFLLTYLMPGSSTSELVFACILLAALILMPNGIWGVAASAWRKVRPQSRKAPLVRALPAPLRRLGRTSTRQTSATREGDPAELSSGVPSGSLSVRGLEVQFGALKALRGVDLDVAAGEVHALIGPNGAGKTTLLNCISGMQRTTAGSIVVTGQSLRRVRATRVLGLGVARTFQNPSLVLDLTVFENVLVGAESGDTSRRRRLRLRSATGAREKAYAALRKVGVGKARWDLPASSLSLAEMKLVDIARAISTGAGIILMDEPTAGLEHEEIDRVVDVIKALAESGTTAVVIAHHVGFVRAVAARTTVLTDGANLVSGPTEEVLQNQLVVDAFLGSPSPAAELSPEEETTHAAARG